MTHTDALVATLTKPKRQAQARTVATSGGCRAKAPCGHRCCCEGSVRHELHICKEPDCLCHSRQRYEQAKEVSSDK